MKLTKTDKDKLAGIIQTPFEKDIFLYDAVLEFIENIKFMFPNDHKPLTVEMIDKLTEEHEERQALLRSDMNNCKEYQSKEAIIKVLNDNAGIFSPFELIRSELLLKK